MTRVAWGRAALCAAFGWAGGCAPSSPQRCNGSEALCARPLDAVVFPATHNSMSNEAEGWGLPNQPFGLLRQLEDGVRGMLIDTYEVDGAVVLCHSVCALGSTDLIAALGEIKGFLDTNPGEVLVFVVQDGASIEATEAAFAAAGLTERLITAPAPGAAWPTLGSLVDRGAQVLLTRESGGDGPAWYRSFYEVGFDTPYSFERPEDFTCDVLRGRARNDLFLVNHWLSTPFPTREGAAEVNAADVLRARVDACEAERGRQVNLVAVDHYDLGDLFAVVDALNAR